jgi:hypothetical protein
MCYSFFVRVGIGSAGPYEKRHGTTDIFCWAGKFSLPGFFTYRIAKVRLEKVDQAIRNFLHLVHNEFEKVFIN